MQLLVHFVLSAGLLALGLYLFADPGVLSARSRLFRGVVIRIGLVLGLKALDYLFLLRGR